MTYHLDLEILIVDEGMDCLASIFTNFPTGALDRCLLRP